MEEIIEKMIESDVLVLATPVYFYSMNAHHLFLEHIFRYLKNL